VSELRFLSPEACAPSVRIASPLDGFEASAAVCEVDGIGMLELRGELDAFQPGAGVSLLPLGYRRTLLVAPAPVAPLLARASELGLRVYDRSAGLAALEFTGRRLLARLCERRPEELPTSTPVAGGVWALVEDRGEGRFRLYVSRELARYVAEVVVDLDEGLER
jgi:hypothetical protein